MIPIRVQENLANLHFDKVKDNIVHHINRILRKGSIKKKNGTVNLSVGLRNYLVRLKDLNNNLLKSLICKTPEDLMLYVQSQNAMNSSFIDEANSDNIILRNIFITHGYEKKLDTCSYCNRNYIYTTKKNKEVKPEIDHFFPKSKYPILGLSYFNLIPSCKPCNGFGAKEEKDPFVFNLINPYSLKDDDFVFTHKIKNIAIVNPLTGKSDVEIGFANFKQGHLDVFNLKELYELHFDHVLELIIKRNIKYSTKYRAYLNSYKGLKLSKAEIDRMILGNYSLETDQHKRPLSKMYQDIGKELGLIK